MLVHGGIGGGNQALTDGLYQRTTWRLAWEDATTPTSLSLRSARATSNSVHVDWFVGGQQAHAFNLERSEATGGWERMTTIASDGAGLIEFEDGSVTPGRRYGYRLCDPSAQRTDCQGEVWIDVPLMPALGLVGFSPNPSSGAAFVTFSLGEARPARLEIVDVFGRRVFEQALDGVGAGAHVVGLSRGLALPPGAYFIRLTQGAATVTRQGIIVR